jgi:hypothetical protein
MLQKMYEMHSFDVKNIKMGCCNGLGLVEQEAVRRMIRVGEINILCMLSQILLNTHNSQLHIRFQNFLGTMYLFGIDRVSLGRLLPTLQLLCYNYQN